MTCIVVVAHPGHYRESLVALLHALPSVSIEVMAPITAHTPDPADNIYPLDLRNPLDDYHPDIVIFDQSAGNCLEVGIIEAVQKNWPQARRVFLVDNYKRINGSFPQGADCVLTMGAPAGEFLAAIEQVLEHCLPSSEPTERLAGSYKANESSSHYLNQSNTMVGSRFVIASTMR